MLIEEKVRFHRIEEISKELPPNGKKNNIHRCLFNISIYTYGSNAKKLMYLSKLKNE